MKAILLTLALLVAVTAATPVVTAHVADACEISDPSCGPYLPPTPENPLDGLQQNYLPLTVLSETALMVGLN